MLNRSLPSMLGPGAKMVAKPVLSVYFVLCASDFCEQTEQPWVPQSPKLQLEQRKQKVTNRCRNAMHAIRRQWRIKIKYSLNVAKTTWSHPDPGFERMCDITAIRAKTQCNSHPTTLMALWDIECTLEDAQQTCTLQDWHDNCRILCRFLKHKGFCTQSGSAWLSWGFHHAPLLSGARGCTSPRAATLPNNGNYDILYHIYQYIKITNNINIIQYPLRKVS